MPVFRGNQIEEEGNVSEINFDDGNAPWQIQNNLRCKQIDGHNCGLIAYVIIMEIYGCWLCDGAVNKIANNKGGYRTEVTRITYFSLSCNSGIR